MKYTVTHDIVNATVQCADDFSCLYGEGECLCEVIGCSPDSDSGILYIHHADDIRSCRYEMFFGNSFVCNCPVRKELYRQYHV